MRPLFSKKFHWDPYRIPLSVLKGWMVAADHSITALMTDDGAGVISSWTDRIGGVAFTAVTTARPVYGAATFNSAYPGVTSDGVNQCLVSTAYTAWPTSTTAGWIMMLFQNASVDVSGTRNIMMIGAANPVRLFRNLGQPGPIQRLRVSDGTTNHTDSVDDMTGCHMLAGEWSGTSGQGWVDGTAIVGNPATFASVSTDTTRARIFASSAASPGGVMPGTLAELIVGQGTLSTADRQHIEGYWAWTYNLVSLLPTTHPYKLQRT